jgi:hypothetical protein
MCCRRSAGQRSHHIDLYASVGALLVKAMLCAAFGTRSSRCYGMVLLADSQSGKAAESL